MQGPELSRMTDRTAPRVTISHHADVRLMLMRQKAWAEGMRALVLFTASQQDRVELSAARGEVDEDAVRLNDLLLPIVKGYGSEKAYELLATSLQVFGGSGFTQDHPIEQYIRDAKIDTLYEGTTTIQGMDLFFRKIVKDQGRALALLAAQVQEFSKGDSGNGTLAAERELLGRALDDVQGIVGHCVTELMAAAEDTRHIDKVGLNTTRLLMALGDLVVGWLLLRQAAVAIGKLPATNDRDQSFYRGKIAAAKWFAANVFPKLSAERAIAEATDLMLMELDEAAF